MNRLIFIILFMFGIILIAPFCLMVIDSMCYFYTSASCSGLDYTKFERVLAGLAFVIISIPFFVIASTYETSI